MNTITKETALYSLAPEGVWCIDNGVINWQSPNIPQPTDAEIQAEIDRLQAEHDAKDYARKRASEYPPMADYIDGVVKGDQDQIDAYIAACLAVKAKYPKP
jgi:hypothetical protein